MAVYLHDPARFAIAPTKFKTALRDTAIVRAEEAAEDARAAHRAAAAPTSGAPKKIISPANVVPVACSVAPEGARAAAEAGCSSKSSGIVASSGADITTFRPEPVAQQQQSEDLKGAAGGRAVAGHQAVQVSLHAQPQVAKTRKPNKKQRKKLAAAKQRDAEAGQSQPSPPAEGSGGGGEARTDSHHVGSPPGAGPPASEGVEVKPLAEEDASSTDKVKVETLDGEGSSELTGIPLGVR